MNTKKLIAGGAAVMLSLTLAACGNGNKANSDVDSSLPSPRVSADAKTPAWQKETAAGTLKWYIDFDWFTNLTWGQDTVTKQITKDTKTTVTWTSGNDDKLNTMIAANSLPDMITVPVGSPPDLMLRKNAAKLLLPLDSLAKKYDPYFLEGSDGAKAEVVKWYTLADGHFYGYPSYALTSEDYKNPNLTGTSAFLVRKDIYEALGKPDMTTPDGFLNALKAAKQKYPNVVPFSATNLATGGAIGDTLMNFLAIPKQIDGKYNDRYTNADYLKWMETLRQAHDAGLISDDDFADTTGDKFKEKLDTNGYFAVLAEGTPQLSGNLNKAAGHNPAATYIAVDAMQNTAKDTPQLTQTGISGWTVTYITKKCSDPERAIDLMQYLVSDPGQRAIFYGTEGTTFTLKNGVPTLNADVKALQLSDNDKFKKIYRMGEVWMLGNDMYKIKLGVSHADDTAAMQQIYDWTKGKMHPNFDTENYDPTGTSIEAKNLQNINAKWATTVVGMVRAKSNQDLQTVLKTWTDFRDKNGWNKIVAYRETQIAENVKKLG